MLHLSISTESIGITINSRWDVISAEFIANIL